MNELSTISIFFSGVRFPYLFPPGVAVLRIKSTWLYNLFLVNLVAHLVRFLHREVMKTAAFKIVSLAQFAQ